MPNASELIEKAKQDVTDKRFREALGAADQALALAPKDPMALHYRALASLGLGDHAAAIADHTRILELYPDRSSAYYNRGSAKRQAGDFRGALADYEAFLAANPGDADARRMRALCLAELGTPVVEGGRLAAPPGSLDKVPRALTVRQTFGFGVPTFALTLIVGAAALAARRGGQLDDGGLAIVGGALLIGALVLVLHVLGRTKPLALVPTAVGIAIYRRGKLVGEAKMSAIRRYEYHPFNTLRVLVVFGVAVFGAFKLADKDPGVLVALGPVLVILLSELRNRFTLTGLYVLKGTGLTMYRSGEYQRAFGG